MGRGMWIRVWSVVGGRPSAGFVPLQSLFKVFFTVCLDVEMSNVYVPFIC